MISRIPVRVEEPIGVSRHQYPITQGCAFPQGVLPDPRYVRLSTSGCDELPLQTTVLARWPDRSIKWLLLDTQMDTRPRQIHNLKIEYGPEIVASPVTSALRLIESDRKLTIETGALRINLLRRGAVLIETAGDVIAGNGPQMLLRDDKGAVFTGRTEKVEIEESHALRAVVKASGGFFSDEGRCVMSWIVRFYCYARQPFVKIYHTFVHDQNEPLFFQMQEMTFRLPLTFGKTPRVMTGSPKWTISLGDDWGEQTDMVSMWETGAGPVAVFGVEEGRVDRSNPGHGWIYAGDADRGVQIKLRHPAQNYPKRYTTDGRNMEIHLYPDPTGWTAPEKKGLKYTELSITHDGEYTGALQIPQGMAKTHELFLYAGAAHTDLTAAAECAAACEYPLLLEIDSIAWEASGALGTFPRYYPEYWRLEASLNRAGDAMTGSALSGMINYGDTGLTTTENGKQKTLTTDNVAYDHIRSPLRQFLRRGDQSLFWQAEVMALHLMDIDTVHHSTQFPERIGGPASSGRNFTVIRTSRGPNWSSPEPRMYGLEVCLIFTTSPDTDVRWRR